MIGWANQGYGGLLYDGMEVALESGTALDSEDSTTGAAGVALDVISCSTGAAGNLLDNITTLSGSSGNLLDDK